MNLKKFIKSIGLKRYISSSLSTLIGIAMLFPKAQVAIGTLQTIAGAFGIAGLTHATAAKTLSQAKLAAAASFLAFLIALAPFIPQLQPYVQDLQELAAILGAAAAGVITAKLQK